MVEMYGIEWYSKTNPNDVNRGKSGLTLMQAVAWRDDMNKKHPNLHHAIFSSKDALEVVSEMSGAGMSFYNDPIMEQMQNSEPLKISVVGSMLIRRKTNTHLLKKKETKFYQILNKKRAH